MKIRWNESSVRFRITPQELAALENGQPITEELALPSGAAWSTQITPGSKTTNLAFASGVLQMQISAADVTQLSAPQNEGVYFRDGALRFFIEKDFPCAHPRGSEAAEPETETFSPPPGFEERKS